jgi:hypothetical protein
MNLKNCRKRSVMFSYASSRLDFELLVYVEIIFHHPICITGKNSYTQNNDSNKFVNQNTRNL